MLVPFRVISSGCNALVVLFQQLLEGHMEVLLCGRVNDICHSLLVNSCVLASILLPHLPSSLIDSLPSLNLLCHSKTDARFMQDGTKAALWSIPYVSVAFFLSLKHFIAYRSSKVSSCPDCIFEIHQLWQSGISRVYSNSWYNCSFEPWNHKNWSVIT